MLPSKLTPVTIGVTRILLWYIVICYQAAQSHKPNSL